jgi:ribonucleotide reductase alpha subunit
LGMIELQNAWDSKNLSINSEEAIRFGENCAQIMSEEIINESCQLPKEDRAWEVFESSESGKGKMPFDFARDGGSGTLPWDTLRHKRTKNDIRNAYLNTFSQTKKNVHLLGCYLELSPAIKIFSPRDWMTITRW